MRPVPLRFKPLSSSLQAPAAPSGSRQAEAAAVPSPCISVCQMDSRLGLCRGCGRTLEEITLWSRLDEESRRSVWAALPERGFPGLDTGP
jgi:predicted Fe-S protein YdhL (DUF1289 family)